MLPTPIPNNFRLTIIKIPILQIQLDWDAYSPADMLKFNIIGFRLYRSGTSGQHGTVIQDETVLTSDVLQTIDNTIQLGQDYYYQLIAVEENGYSLSRYGTGEYGTPP